MSGNLWGEIAGSAPREVRGLEALNSEGITKYARLTAFLPNLAGFSIRSGALQFNCPTKASKTGGEGPSNGQHGDARREFVPRRASPSAPRTGCPVSAASAAASPAATARRASPAGGGTAAARSGRTATAPRSGSGRAAASGPPTALGAALGALLLHRDAGSGTAAAGRATRRATAPPARRAPVAHARHEPDERDRRHDHDDRDPQTSHRSHPSFCSPVAKPAALPRATSSLHCFVTAFLRCCVASFMNLVRDWGVPPASAAQS